MPVILGVRPTALQEQSSLPRTLGQLCVFHTPSMPCGPYLRWSKDSVTPDNFITDRCEVPLYRPIFEKYKAVEMYCRLSTCVEKVEGLN